MTPRPAQRVTCSPGAAGTTDGWGRIQLSERLPSPTLIFSKCIKITEFPEENLGVGKDILIMTPKE